METMKDSSLIGQLIGELWLSDNKIGNLVQKLNGKRNLIERQRIEYHSKRQDVVHFKILRFPKGRCERNGEDFLLARLMVSNEKGLTGYVERHCKEHATIAPYVMGILDKFGLPYTNVEGL